MRSSIAAGQTLFFVSRDTGTDAVLSTAQLLLTPQSNSRHRAEVDKMMVHTAARRRIGWRLLLAMQELVLALGRTTLVFDTRHDG